MQLLGQLPVTTLVHWVGALPPLSTSEFKLLVTFPSHSCCLPAHPSPTIGCQTPETAAREVPEQRQRGQGGINTTFVGKPQTPCGYKLKTVSAPCLHIDLICLVIGSKPPPPVLCRHRPFSVACALHTARQSAWEKCHTAVCVCVLGFTST